MEGVLPYWLIPHWPTINILIWMGLAVLAFILGSGIENPRKYLPYVFLIPFGFWCISSLGVAFGNYLLSL